ncbi:hypothetical protein [Nocardia sp. CA-290969]|uniref:hypothetical protein n=1 Tax=Nocardia sp. CA-290969 TaxID=3239986 RepID=UPI003D8C63CF
MKARSTGELIAALDGRRVKYLPFWGHHPRPDGEIGASCLSQWWPPTDPRIEDPVRWEGLNLLGFALMEAREVLRS